MSGAEFHPDALSELRAAADFYEERVEGLGHRFVDAVARAVGFATERPAAGRVLTRGIRRRVVGGFPYAVIYAVHPAGILIVAVAHQHRRPGYWRRRVRRR